MGFRSVDSGVERLVAWAENILNNPIMADDSCMVYSERSYRDCLLFGKSPCVNLRIEDTKKDKIYIETSFLLYPLVPPILGLCAEARNLDLLEKVNASLHKKGLPYRSALDIK